MFTDVHGSHLSTKVLTRQVPKCLQDSLDSNDMDTNYAHVRKVLAANVKRLREAAGLSQNQLAKRSGVAQTAISYVERPEGKSPSLETIVALANALHTTHISLIAEMLENATASDANTAANLYSTYLRLPSDGRAQCLRVAETETRYHVTKTEAQYYVTKTPPVADST